MRRDTMRASSVLLTKLIVILAIMLSSTLVWAQRKYPPLEGTTPQGKIVRLSSLPPTSGSLSKPVPVPIRGRSYSSTVQKYMKEQRTSSHITASQELDNSAISVNAPLVTQTTTSLSGNFQGITYTGTVPPDPVIAVGHNYVLVAVNRSLAVFTKSGSKLSQTGFQTLFNITNGDNIGDPKAIYDQYSQRYVMLVLDFDAGYYLIAASESSDPTGSWYTYRSDAKYDGNTYTGYYPDYPGLGYDSKAIYVTSNRYGVSSPLLAA